MSRPTNPGLGTLDVLALRLEELLQDTRFGYRTFVRRPTFTLSVLAILAVGIGASTTIFSVVNGVLLTPLPYRAPENLVRVFGAWEHGSREGISPPDFADYRRDNTVFDGVAAAGNSTPLVGLKAAGDPEQVPSRTVTSGFFSTIGIQPVLGREFRVEEEVWHGPPVVILSYGLWQRQFGGDRAVIGRPVAINGAPTTIVGVLPPFFNFLGAAELFTPTQANPVPQMRGIRTFVMIGRLKAGVDLDGARRQLETLSQRLQRDQALDRGWTVAVSPLTAEVVKDVRPALLMLLGAVGLVVLLVSANVASLILSQAAIRHEEISLRLSLGASHARVVRQLVTESLLIAVVGGVIGCGLGAIGVRLIKTIGPATIPRLSDLGVDARVLAFSLGVSVGMGILFGLEPAWRVSRRDLAAAMKGRATTRRAGLRDVFVLSEVAISVILLIGAGLALRSMQLLSRVNPGFESTHVLTTRLAVRGSKYSDATGDKVSAFWNALIPRIEAIPGVTSAGVTSELPLGGLNNPTPRQATTSDGKIFLTSLRSVSPHYAAAMRIPLRAGRFLSRDDHRQSPRAVVINEQFQKEVFGNRNPLGEHLTFDFRERSDTNDYQAVIVGIIGSVRHSSLASPPVREAYLAVEQSPLPTYDLVVRTAVPAASIAPSVRRSVWAIDPDLAIGGMRVLEGIVGQGLAQPRFRGDLLGLFALFALVLASAGIYGLLSFMVTERTREIGIRVAIGASPTRVLGFVTRRAVAPTTIGVAVGVIVSAGLGRVLSTLVFGISVRDPVIFILAPASLVIVATIAACVPAIRATRLDPVAALRES